MTAPWTGRPVQKESWWIRSNETRFAIIFLIVGFIAVFLQQADPLLQILFGAPIFEESLKFGLALWLGAALRIRPLAARLPIGLCIGAAFGVMEHFWGYSGESGRLLVHRLSFHALTTSLSLVSYHVLRKDRLSRWGATLPAFLVHYVNNTVAVVIAFAWADRTLTEVEHAIEPFLLGIMASLVLLHALVAVGARPFRAMAHGIVRGLARHM